MGRHRVGVFIHIHQWCVAAFLGTAQGFFQHVGQATGVVAGADATIDLGVAALVVFQPPVDAVNQFATDFGGGGSGGQGVFDAENFRGLGENRGPAVAHQNVNRSV
ncbi:hypothetical protein D3C76_1272940 [compost metagenome]